MELSIGPLEESTEPAFQITGVWGTRGPAPGHRQDREHFARACLFLRGHTSTCQAAGRAAGQGPPELRTWPRSWPTVPAGAIGSPRASPRGCAEP